MLARENRLVRSADFVATARGGSRAGDRLLSVHRRATPAHEPARIGFVVSRAVGGSVVRSKVKRRLRHAVRARLDRLRDGEQVVVRAHPASATADFAELVGALDRCLERACRPRAAGAPPAESSSSAEVGGP